MSDQQTLSQKLAALATRGETFENGARVVSDGTAPPVIEAILSEIDTTVLTRELTFSADKTEISLVAGGRRLRGLIKASADIKGVLGVLGKIVSADDIELLTAVHEILQQFADTTAKVTVQSRDATALADQTDGGISASQLATLWGIDLNAAPPTQMQSYIRNLGATTTAWMLIDADGDTTTGGDGTHLEALRTAFTNQGAAFLESVDSLTNSVGLVCLNGALGDTLSVATCRTATETAILCYASDNVGELHAKWATLTH